MNKQTQILLGVGALAVVGYLVYKNNTPAKKANATGFTCPRGSSQSIVKTRDGDKYFQCIDRRGIRTIYDGNGSQVY
jgi:hypothetical protein